MEWVVEHRVDISDILEGGVDGVGGGVGVDGETFHSQFEADGGGLGGVDPEFEQRERN